MFHNVYGKRKVLVTGHTGFKGSWLALWLEKLGAEFLGVALPPENSAAHFSLIGGEKRFATQYCDIRDPGKLEKIFSSFQPEIVFHLAAQPLVLRSYEDPVGTFDTNILGTVHVLEACRKTSSVRAAVVITTDKCYENTGEHRPKKETDPMGGYDPYSASKGCAEIVSAAYRKSFAMNLATARAGNVIGGGDWAENRLVPDLMRSAAAGKTEVLRNPSSVRPWQFVLEPLSGYLLLGEKLLAGDVSFQGPWNFGPDPGAALSVEEASAILALSWEKIRYEHASSLRPSPHEAAFLTLDSTKAHERLEWHPVTDVRQALELTANWYRTFAETGKTATEQDLEIYCAAARAKGIKWAIH